MKSNDKRRPQFKLIHLLAATTLIAIYIAMIQGYLGEFMYRSAWGMFLACFFILPGCLLLLILDAVRGRRPK